MTTESSDFYQACIKANQERKKPLQEEKERKLQKEMDLRKEAFKSFDINYKKQIINSFRIDGYFLLYSNNLIDNGGKFTMFHFSQWAESHGFRVEYALDIYSKYADTIYGYVQLFSRTEDE